MLEWIVPPQPPTTENKAACMSLDCIPAFCHNLCPMLIHCKHKV